MQKQDFWGNNSNMIHAANNIKRSAINKKLSFFRHANTQTKYDSNLFFGLENNFRKKVRFNYRMKNYTKSLQCKVIVILLVP